MGFPPGDDAPTEVAGSGTPGKVAGGGTPAEVAGGGVPAEVAGGGVPAEQTPATAGGGAPAREAAGTGDPRVDEAVRHLDELAELPVSEHPAVFEYVHKRLTEVLGDLDVGPGAGGDVRGPGGTGR